MADLQKMRSVTARDAEEEAQMTRYGDIYTLCPHLSIYLHYLHTVRYLYMATYSWVRPAQVWGVHAGLTQLYLQYLRTA